MTSILIPGAGTGSLLESELLADDRSVRIGAIHRIDYDEAIVLTHDKWKHDAAGIPQFCFLLATARDVSAAGFDDDEVLLLRVEGTAPLAMESDLLAVREESLRNVLAESNDPKPSVVLDMDLDPFTKNRVSYTGLRCKVLGTFYEEDIDGQKYLQFGADVDNFYATTTYRVLKPVGEGLACIASYLKPQAGRPIERVRIGEVRYSATRRRAQQAAKTAGYPDPAVRVNIHDFIGTKTGLLGMTRTGKSNTAKTLIARTFVVSESERSAGRQPIGQLIFDPQGEYANDNPQDDSAIAAIGANHVRIFMFGADGTAPHVRPLGINFFDENQIEAVQGMIADQLRAEGSSGYVNDFAVASFHDDPTDYPASNHASRARLCLYGALVRAGFKLPANQSPPNHQWPYSVMVSARKDFADAVNAEVGREVMQPGPAKGKVKVAGADIEACVQAIVDIRTHDSHPAQSDAEDFAKDTRWKSTEPIFSAESSGGGKVRGWRNLLDLKAFHNAATTQDPSDEIYEHLVSGRIVIVDLHVGTPTVIRSLSENIARRLLKRQTDKFTSGGNVVLPRIQVMLEEAHNLFSSDKYRDDGDVWVKLAKEASKLQIGMAYATQEVSGVAHQVKANTSNWVVAHLNNTKEVHDLGQFYDFASFADSIVAAEDKGYVRLKTQSSPYIVPVQIDRYGLDLVNEARAAAGDEELVRLPSGDVVPASQAQAASVASQPATSPINGSGPQATGGQSKATPPAPAPDDALPF
jgi:hypothetical protein